MNKGFAHFNFIHGGTTDRNAGNGNCAVRFSINNAVAHPFEGNIVTVKTNGTSTYGLYNEYAQSSFAPFTRNAIHADTDLYQVAAGAENLLKGDWNPVSALVNYTNIAYYSFVSFFADDFRPRPEYLSMFGALPFDSVGFSEYRNRSSGDGFQFAFFDVEGRERPQYGDWPIGPWR